MFEESEGKQNAAPCLAHDKEMKRQTGRMKERKKESPVQIRIYYSSNDQLLVYTAAGHLLRCFNDTKNSNSNKNIPQRREPSKSPIKKKKITTHR